MIPCAAVVSRVRKLLIWPIALIIGDGNITVVFFSNPSAAASASSAVARASGAPSSCPTHPKGGRGHRFALGGNKFGALLPLGLGLPGRRAFHTVGQLVILQLDEVHSLPAPLAGRHIEDLLDIDVDDVGFGERLVLGVLTDHLAQRRVRDLG